MSSTRVPGFTLPGIEDITRRDFLVGGAAALLLGGCSGNESGEVGENTTSLANSIRTLTDVFGYEVEVPFSPQRVIFTSSLVLANALALDFPADKVAGCGFAGDYYSSRLYFEPAGFSDPETFNDAGFLFEPNLEAVAVADPDLIVSFGRNDEDWRGYHEPFYDFGRESGVPVFVASNSNEFLGQALRIVADVGRALNLADRAETLGREFAVEVDAFKSRQFSGKVDEVSVLLVGDDQIFMSDTTLLNELGVSTVERTPDGSHSVSISEERLEEADADAIIVASEGEARTATTRRFFEDSPLWSTLDAVRSGNVTYTDYPVFEYALPALRGQFEIIKETVRKV